MKNSIYVCKGVIKFMCKKVIVSFKENERDMQLFIEIMSQNAKSEFIKTCIEYYLKNSKKEGK